MKYRIEEISHPEMTIDEMIVGQYFLFRNEVWHKTHGKSENGGVKAIHEDDGACCSFVSWTRYFLVYPTVEQVFSFQKPEAK